MSVLPECVCVPHVRPEEDIRFPRTRVADPYKLPYNAWSSV